MGTDAIRPIAEAGGVRRTAAGRAAVLAVWLAAVAGGCGHTSPFADEAPESAGDPFTPTPPVRLTFNPLQDLTPRFLPGVPGLLYSYEASDPWPRDRCLGLMPPTGGTRFWEACAGSGGSLDSLDAYGPADLSPGGRLAYVASASSELKRGPDRSTLVVTTLAAPLDTTRIHSFPITIDGVKVDGLTDPRWLDDQHLVYVAQRIDYPKYCNGCDRDTVRTGLGIVKVDLTGAPTMSLVGGPRVVTSLAIADDGAFIYTMAGDSRIFRESPPGGAASVIYDFGVEGTARNVDVMGTLLTAVVGLKVHYVDWPGLGLTVFDSGGAVFVVDLATNTTVFRSSAPLPTPSPVPQGNLFRRSVFVSSNALAVEGLPFTATTNGMGGLDTTLFLLPGDLWRVRFGP